MKLPWASNAELPTKCSEQFEKPDGFCAYLVELTFVRKATGFSERGNDL